MRPIRTFTIVPKLPEKLTRLRELAQNLWWTWNLEAIDLFRRLDRDLWEESGHNPVRMLGTIDQKKLEAAAEDDGFLAEMERVCQRFDQYMSMERTWAQSNYQEGPIAYFSAEFGLTDCLPIFAGGLGILAGDHLKSASDLGLPLIGVGLLYQQGYFRQYLNADGWQQERYPANDFYTMPLELLRDQAGSPLTITVDYPTGPVVAQIWRAQVGRVPLYLLDTNLEVNGSPARDITDQLYGGDVEMRIQQEIMLGIGGIRALDKLGIRPAVCHMNEGHSAFLALERIRLLMQEHRLSFAEAREVSASNVFTIHTSVLAGIDLFSPELMDRYFGSYYPALGLSRDEFLALGRQDPRNNQEPFSMAILALRLAAHTNGVSRLHGRVSRRMWQGVWPQVPEDEVPIGSITNGIHIRSWISFDMATLYDRYLGPGWVKRPTDPEIWARVDSIPDEELWRTHERRRERLVAVARRRLRAQREHQGAAPSEVEAAREALDPEALTIGFARRFTTYKRATLIFRDLDRLIRIVNDPRRPVQIIFAGKAHPRDNPGKELIRQIVHHARREELRRRIVFLEDYDTNLARYLVQGVDVWLNTPRRHEEASGTSGMKAAANGVLNMSILDGWWDEAYQPGVGWAIGRGEVYDDHDYQDEVESSAIYDLLEKEVVPLFYDRGPDGLPRRWIARMKAAIKAFCPIFNTDRMAMEYTRGFYVPAARRYQELTGDLERARALARWKAGLYKQWPDLRVVKVEADVSGEIKVGAAVEVRAEIYLGALKPTDVTVQLYHGPVDEKGELARARVTPMLCASSKGEGWFVFAGSLLCESSGLHGYTVRVLPHHDDLSNPFELGLILWAE